MAIWGCGEVIQWIFKAFLCRIFFFFVLVCLFIGTDWWLQGVGIWADGIGGMWGGQRKRTA